MLLVRSKVGCLSKLRHTVHCSESLSDEADALDSSECVPEATQQ